MVNFVRGLINETELEDSEIHAKNAKILEPYVDQIMETLQSLFGVADSKNY